MVVKILVVNTNLFRFNGISTTIANYYKHIDHKKFAIDIVANEQIEDFFKKQFTSSGSNVYLLKSRNHSPFKYEFELHKIIKKGHYDILYVNGNSSTMSLELMAAIGTKVRKIVHAHASTTDHIILNKFLYFYFINNYDFAFAASKNSGRWLFKDKKFTIIKNGIDPTDFKFNLEDRNYLRKKLRINNNDFVLLQVGAFTEQKNYDFTIKLFSELLKIKKHFQLLLIGEGYLKERIKKKAMELGIYEKIKFMPTSDEICKFYSAADLCLFPSKWEPFGIVSLEAQASGLPVFMSDKFIKDVKVTKNASFIPLKLNLWIDKIISQPKLSRNFDYSIEIKKSGYDIHDNVLELEKLFNRMAK
ncbi:Glycosyl transferase group 1 [Oenococcus oeni]|uniref:glycosyltransferase n=1 Tax=Oenococcus oeni TaxID=1247 RepID=UPI0010B77545|nr:glycosyltransferase [Oenococcus oeni]SYW05550.1 Glycosyl transferase group 1 [Oenococcus oeni]